MLNTVNLVTELMLLIRDLNCFMAFCLNGTHGNQVIKGILATDIS